MPTLPLVVMFCVFAGVAGFVVYCSPFGVWWLLVDVLVFVVVDLCWSLCIVR